jgi:hypothetical protein
MARRERTHGRPHNRQRRRVDPGRSGRETGRDGTGGRSAKSYVRIGQGRLSSERKRHGNGRSRVATAVTPCPATGGPAPRAQSPRRRLPIPGTAFLGQPACRLAWSEHSTAWRDRPRRPTRMNTPLRPHPCHLPPSRSRGCGLWALRPATFFPLRFCVRSSFSFTFRGETRGRQWRNDGSRRAPAERISFDRCLRRVTLLLLPAGTDTSACYCHCHCQGGKGITSTPHHVSPSHSQGGDYVASVSSVLGIGFWILWI